MLELHFYHPEEVSDGSMESHSETGSEGAPAKT